MFKTNTAHPGLKADACEASPLEGQAGPELMRLLRGLMRSMRQALRAKANAHEVEASIEFWIVMGLLDEQDGISQQDLANRCDMDKSVIAKMVDLLEQQGLVVRQTDPDNRRQKRITLTEQGKARYQQMRRFTACIDRQAVAGISAQELATFLSVAKRMGHNLGQYTSQP